jgi:hypothetical protein
MRRANACALSVEAVTVAADNLDARTRAQPVRYACRSRPLLAAATSMLFRRWAPLISLASWGLGPTEPYITGFGARMFVGLAKRTFWAKPFEDFERQLVDIEAARANDLVEPIIIVPPILTNGAETSSYLSGDAHAMKGLMGITSFIARASIADLALKLCEKAASGEKPSSWVAIREGSLRRPRMVSVT